MNVILRSSAENSIISLAEFIAEIIKMPETFEKYIVKLLNFASIIGQNPYAYSLCKYPKWKIENLQCATFDKTWVIAYKIISEKVVVYHIKNGKLLNY